MPNRLAIEAELSAGQRATLAELCRDLCIDPTEWREAPALRTVFDLAASVRCVRRLEAEGRGRREAEAEASRLLGFNEKTLASRMFNYSV